MEDREALPPVTQEIQEGREAVLRMEIPLSLRDREAETAVDLLLFLQREPV